MNREEIEQHLKEVEPLDKFLTNRGVSIESLNSAINETVDYMPELEYYYDFKEKQTDLKKIDTKYIQAPARMGNSGHSWYNLLFWGVYGLPQNKDANLSTLRFYDLLINLTEMDLKSFKALYQDGKSGLSVYNFNKYIKKGEKPLYFGINDGTHRIILAKVLGIDYVTSNKVIVYEYNINKHKLYENLKLVTKNLYKLINNSSIFKLTNDDDNQYISIDVQEFNYMGILLEEVSSYIFNKNEDRYKKYVEKLNNYYEMLKRIESNYTNQINFYKYLPKQLLDFMSLAHKDIYLEELENNEENLLKKIKIMKAIDLKK